MTHDINELKMLLTSGPMQSRLTPTEYQELQESGFLVVPVDIEPDADGTKLCVISLLFL